MCHNKDMNTNLNPTATAADIHYTESGYCLACHKRSVIAVINHSNGEETATCNKCYAEGTTGQQIRPNAKHGEHYDVRKVRK